MVEKRRTNASPPKKPGFNFRAKPKKDTTFEPRSDENGMLNKSFKGKFKSKTELEFDGGDGLKGFANKGFEKKANFKKQFDVNEKKFDGSVRFGRNKFKETKKGSNDDEYDDKPKKKQFDVNEKKIGGSVRFGRNKFKETKKGSNDDDEDDDKPKKKQFDVNEKKFGGSVRFGRNRVKETKKGSINDDEDDDKPKKRKKRVIRLDRYDSSNKRMDDTTECKIVKKEEPEDNQEVEISKNAQFRAILPSPSILSFVEENLLGRRREIELRRAGYNTEIQVPLDNIPSCTEERARIEETVFRNKLTFFAAAKVSSSLPPPEVPEIAFAGRSNVGKSSILNALTRQWGVVRTSDKPGLTQTINFFQLGPKLSLVDLPGYGFAYAKEEVKEAWEELVKEYVSTRVGLKQVCLLIDTKWGMKPRDHELINLMERSQTKYQIVLTKTDLVFPIDVARRAMQIEEKLKANKSVVQPVMMVSSKSGAGIRCLRTALAKIARFAKL